MKYLVNGELEHKENTANWSGHQKWIGTEYALLFGKVVDLSLVTKMKTVIKDGG